jgi:hypothetical protein
MSSQDSRSAPAGCTACWWLPQDVPVGRTLECELGPFALQLHHAEGEWHLTTTVGEETDAPTLASLTSREGGLETDQYERILMARTDARVHLKPVLADRPVVIRPWQQVILPAGEETVMYMSTPVSLRLEVGEPPVLLREVALLRLSDTWFGPSTREGELCYSGKTHARHALAEVPRRVHRALTPVHIHNRAGSPLPLDKISLPVPLLSLYGDAEGYLWTQGVSLVRTSDTDMAALKIDAKPPAAAGKAPLVTGPRELQARGGLVRAFSVLFRE